MVNKRVSSCSELVTMREESSTVQSLKDEFTQRIADAERKAQLACKERDIAKKVMLSRIVCEFSSRLKSESKNAQLKSCCFFCFSSGQQEIKGLREELSTRLNSVDTMELIRDKEEQIRGLLEEGESY